MLRPREPQHLDEIIAHGKRVRDQRRTLRSALGYALRQEDALCRLLDDGRLLLDNNRSERQIKTIALGRMAWRFVGSDDHGMAARHLMTLIASTRLYGLVPEIYLRDFFRVVPRWQAAAIATTMSFGISRLRLKFGVK